MSSSDFRHLSSRFNGAVASQRRNDVVFPLDGSRDILLQWGRRLSATEWPIQTHAGANAGPASMGPSPLSDGMEANRDVTDVTDVTKLQWGRRLSATE